MLDDLKLIIFNPETDEIYADIDVDGDQFFDAIAKSNSIHGEDVFMEASISLAEKYLTDNKQRYQHLIDCEDEPWTCAVYNKGSDYKKLLDGFIKNNPAALVHPDQYVRDRAKQLIGSK